MALVDPKTSILQPEWESHTLETITKKGYWQGSLSVYDGFNEFAHKHGFMMCQMQLTIVTIYDPDEWSPPKNRGIVPVHSNKDGFWMLFCFLMAAVLFLYSFLI